MNKLRIIIGHGTATEIFRSTVSSNGYDTIILGPRGLWAQLPQTHRMGQTPQLLQMPGQDVPSYTAASGQTPLGLNAFLDVNNYQQGLLALSRQNDARSGTIEINRPHEGAVDLEGCWVTGVERFRRDQLLVKTQSPSGALNFIADQVVIATGIGPQRSPNPPDGIHGEPAGLNYPQLQEGIEYLNAQPPFGQEVAVFGGSATAAWVAAEAMVRSRRLLWFTRPGGSEFRGCTLPGDRNYIILQQTANLRLLADLQRIDYLPEKRVGARVLRHAMVKLTLRPATGPDRVCLVDQLIYSIGGDAGGDGSVRRMLDGALLAELQPLRDHNRVISRGDGVLALATPAKDLLVIGAGTYNFASANLQKQSAPMSTLPTASQVPDGIAMIVASVSAANDYIPIKQDDSGNVIESNINLNLADRNQLAVYLATFYPELGPAAANEIVIRAINLRSSNAAGREFGISEAQFEEIIRQYLG